MQHKTHTHTHTHTHDTMLQKHTKKNRQDFPFKKNQINFLKKEKTRKKQNKYNCPQKKNTREKEREKEIKIHELKKFEK